jgi:hypothetical protein
LAGAAPAHAQTADPTLRGHVTCMTRYDNAFSYDPDGPGGQAPVKAPVVVASLGYESTHPGPVAYPAGGSSNFFVPETRDRGQPSTFQPGRHEGAATIAFNGYTTPKMFWVVESTITTIDADDTTTPRCVPTVLSAPSALVLPVADLTDDAATLSGVVAPGGLETTAHLEWGTDPDAPDRRSPDETVRVGQSVAALRADLEGLTPATTYHARVVATNAQGTTRSAPLRFTTASGPQAPAAVTGLAGSVGTDVATLAGAVDPRGRPTTVRFELGTDERYGTTVPAAELDGGLSAVSARVTGLTPGTTYHYRVVAESDAGRSVGADQAFTTGTVPGASPPGTGTPDAPGVGPLAPAPLAPGPGSPAGGAPAPRPGPPRTTPRSPGLRVMVPRRVRGTRVTLTVRRAAGAVGTLRVTARRGSTTVPAQRRGVRGGTTSYRLSGLRPGVYAVRVVFTGRDGWATRSVRSRLRVRAG